MENIPEFTLSQDWDCLTNVFHFWDPRTSPGRPREEEVPHPSVPIPFNTPVCYAFLRRGATAWGLALHTSTSHSSGGWGGGARPKSGPWVDSHLICYKAPIPLGGRVGGNPASQPSDLSQGLPPDIALRDQCQNMAKKAHLVHSRPRMVCQLHGAPFLQPQRTLGEQPHSHTLDNLLCLRLVGVSKTACLVNGHLLRKSREGAYISPLYSSSGLFSLSVPEATPCTCRTPAVAWACSYWPGCRLKSERDRGITAHARPHT